MTEEWIEGEWTKEQQDYGDKIWDYCAELFGYSEDYCDKIAGMIVSSDEMIEELKKWPDILGSLVEFCVKLLEYQEQEQEKRFTRIVSNFYRKYPKLDQTSVSNFEKSDLVWNVYVKEVEREMKKHNK